jgi:hypothetical protein
MMKRIAFGLLSLSFLSFFGCEQHPLPGNPPMQVEKPAAHDAAPKAH